MQGVNGYESLRMKKKVSRSKVSNSNVLSASGGGTCSFTCIGGEWQLSSDDSEPGYYCEDSLGECPPDQEGETVVVDAWPDGTEEEGGTEEGGTDDGGGSLASTQALPKNTALYRFVRSRKVVRRVRGAWAKGYYTPLEMTLKELAKFAPKVYKIVKVISKNRAVDSFQVLIPAQKLPRKKKGASTGAAKLPPQKAHPKAAVKKAKPKTAGKKGATPKKKR